jgi:hypothetical protein
MLYRIKNVKKLIKQILFQAVSLKEFLHHG